MIKAINPVSACAKMNCNLNSKPKKTSNAHSIVTSSVNHEKLPLFYYQPVFKGKNFHVINSQRKCVDYGENLYIGAYGPPSDTEKVYSVFRDRAKAEDLELNGKDLSNYSFEKSTLFDCEFKGAKLENTTFEGSNLWACKFNGAKMRSVNFRHTNLCDANFRGAEFGRNVDMSGADLMGADLRDTDLKYVKLDNAIYNETTLFPENMPKYKFKKMIYLPDGADFTLPPLPPSGKEDEYEKERKRFEFAKIRYFMIHDVNFTNNSLKRADLKSWKTNNCTFENANLTRAYARKMRAKNCNFSGAKMKQINFSEAEFKNVNMQNADLRGAIFTFKTAENLDLRGTIYDQYTVFNEGFDPEKNGMIFKKSSPRDYGAKTPEQVWEMLGAEIW